MPNTIVLDPPHSLLLGSLLPNATGRKTPGWQPTHTITTSSTSVRIHSRAVIPPPRITSSSFRYAARAKAPATRRG